MATLCVEEVVRPPSLCCRSSSAPAWLARGCESGLSLDDPLSHWMIRVYSKRSFIDPPRLRLMLDPLCDAVNARRKSGSLRTEQCCCLSGTWCSVSKCVVLLRHREDRESRFLSSRMAIVAAFRSWSGKDWISAGTHYYFCDTCTLVVNADQIFPSHNIPFLFCFCFQGLSTYARLGILGSSL